MQLQLHTTAMATIIGHLRPATSVARLASLLLSRMLSPGRLIVASARPVVGELREPRYLYHLVILLMTAAAVFAGALLPNPFAGGTASLPVLPPITAEPDVLETSAIPEPRTEDPAGRISIAALQARFSASQPTDKPADQQPSPAAAKPKTPSTYKVTEGDTVSGIAERFGISSETVMWANSLSDPDSLQIGDELVILPVSGALHTVSGGDNLNDLALLYDVAPESIVEFNALSDPSMLQLGEKLVVPGGKAGAAGSGSSRANRVQAAPAATGSFRWPAGGSITQYFGEDGHTGLDLACGTGSPIYAAESGVVVTALKLGTGYGWHLVVDHGNGYKTLYGHMSGFNVDYGERVAKGDRIGSVGNTGLSTGPHLHLELIQNGGRVNPLKFLP
jgi:murein DD-endopeptidase MepM/ murein hydrolase activator NlpD